MKVKLNIRRRMTLIVLSTSLVTLIILGGVAFYGMSGVRDLALESAQEIGVRSALNSSTTLEMQQKKELSLLAGDKANAINQQLDLVALDVKKIADQMNFMQANPNMFAPSDIEMLDESSNADIAFYVRRSADAVFSRSELGFTANIRDFMIRAVETNEMIDSMSVVARQNFSVTVDDNRAIPIGNRLQPSAIYDSVANDWYQRAALERAMIFTDVQLLNAQKSFGMYCAAPYFYADGSIAGVVCARASLDRIVGIVDEVSLRDSGFCFVLDNRGRVIIASNRKNHSVDNPSEVAVGLNADIRSSENLALADVAAQMVEGFKGIRAARIDGKTYIVSYAPIDRTDWSFAVAFDETAVLDPIVENAELIKSLTQKTIGELDQHMQNTMIYLGVFMVLLLIATAYIGRRLSNHFVEPIHQLSDGVREISSGDLNKKLEIRTGDEIESLAISFNAMTDRLQSYIENLTRATADREHIETELNVASNIQQAMLPRDFEFDRTDFEIYATMHAAKEVGGDFYDFYFLDGDRLMIAIADVSGKGVPAALFMVISKTVLKNFSLTATDIASAVSQANYQLCQNNDEMMFVTVFVGVIELRTGRMIYVNAGHNPPLVRRSGRFEFLTVEDGCALGIGEDEEYRQDELKMSSGDVIFLYTDGVTEAMNADGDQYSDARLIDRLNGLDEDLTAELIVKAVARDIKNYVDGAEQSDDITMLALKFNGLDENGDRN